MDYAIPVRGLIDPRDPAERRPPLLRERPDHSLLPRTSRALINSAGVNTGRVALLKSWVFRVTIA